MEKVNIEEQLTRFSEPWSPRIVGEPSPSSAPTSKTVTDRRADPARSRGVVIS